MKKFQGRIKTLREGFGFITQGNEDVFFHANNLDGIKFNELCEGDELEFIIGMGKNGKQMAGYIKQIKALVEEIENDPSILEKSEKRTALLEIFSKLPLISKPIFIFILINVLLSQVNSISANLLTPIVENYISEISTPNSCDTEKIIPLSMEFNNYLKGDFRFITGEYVRLRKSPSTESEIFSELQLGQVFRVLSQNGNWLEIEYNDEKRHGWVSAKYTAKFVFDD